MSPDLVGLRPARPPKSRMPDNAAHGQTPVLTRAVRARPSSMPTRPRATEELVQPGVVARRCRPRRSAESCSNTGSCSSARPISFGELPESTPARRPRAFSRWWPSDPSSCDNRRRPVGDIDRIHTRTAAVVQRDRLSFANARDEPRNHPVALSRPVRGDEPENRRCERTTGYAQDEMLAGELGRGVEVGRRRRVVLAATVASPEP